MKKFLFMLAFVLPMFFVSCSKDEDDKKNETLDMVLGTWEIIEVDLGDGKGYQDWLVTKTTATFNKDGSYSAKGFFGNGTGTYELAGKTITCYIEGEEFAKYDILNLTANTAELKMYESNNADFMKFKCVKK